MADGKNRRTNEDRTDIKSSGIYINLRRPRDGAFVRSCGIRVCFTLDSFSSLWPAFTLCTSTHFQYNEIVHRKHQHTSGINMIL